MIYLKQLEHNVTLGRGTAGGRGFRVVTRSHRRRLGVHPLTVERSAMESAAHLVDIRLQNLGVEGGSLITVQLMDGNPCCKGAAQVRSVASNGGLYFILMYNS